MARTKNFDQQEVLEKALDLFWMKGYNATSIQDLVDHLGINRASIYDTWGDKHSLYIKALALYKAGNSEWLKGLMQAGLPAIEIIKNFLDLAITESINDCNSKGCFMVNSTTELFNNDQSVIDLVSHNRDFVISELTSVIERGKKEGDITSDEPSGNLATFLFSLLNGIRVMGQTQMSKKSLNSISAIAVTALN